MRGSCHNQQISVSLSHRCALMSFIAAILVVFIHAPHELPKGTVVHFIANFLGEGICNIAVPYFFVLSGYMIARHTHEKGWWGEQLGKRIRTLLVPFLIWCGILSSAVVVQIVVANILHHESLGRNLNLMFFVNAWGLNPLANPPAPLWYLRTLLLFVLLSPLIVKMMMTRWRYLMSAGLFLLDIYFVSVVCERYPVLSMFFWFTCTFNGLFYFMAGFLLFGHPIALKKAISVCVFLGGLILTALKILSMGGGLIHLPLLSYFSVDRLGTLLVLIGVWGLIPSWTLPSWLQNISFPIYLIHMLFVAVFATALKICPWNLTDWQLCGYYFFSGILSVLLSIGAASAMRSVVPRFSALSFGGR